MAVSKRNIEYLVQARIPGVDVTKWLNDLAEERWELITYEGTYGVFKRPIIDEYFRNLQETLEIYRKMADENPTQHNDGVRWGLSLAYSMYTQ